MKSADADFIQRPFRALYLWCHGQAKSLSVLSLSTDKHSLSVPPIDEMAPCSKLLAPFCFLNADL
jgi:hypothetical protein